MNTQPELGTATESIQVTEPEQSADGRALEGRDESQSVESIQPQGDPGASNPAKILTRMAAGIAHEIAHPAEVIRSNGDTVGDYLTTLANLVLAYAGLVEAFGDQDKQAITEHRRRIKQLRENEDVPFVLDDAKAVLRETHDSIARLQNLAGRLNELSRDEELGDAHTLVLKGARIRAPVRASGAQCVHLV